MMQFSFAMSMQPGDEETQQMVPVFLSSQNVRGAKAEPQIDRADQHRRSTKENAAEQTEAAMTDPKLQQIISRYGFAPSSDSKESQQADANFNSDGPTNHQPDGGKGKPNPLLDGLVDSTITLLDSDAA